MKILVIGKFYTEGFALHISESLADMGHSVHRFEPGFKVSRFPGLVAQRFDELRSVIYSATDNVPTIRQLRIKSLWNLVDVNPLDLVIVCKDFLWPEEVQELKRRSSAQVVMWFPDPIGSFNKAMFMNAPYDALFFKDPFIIYVLKDVLHSPVFYLPECFNPQRHCLPKHGEIHPEYMCDITTAGGMHPWRVAFFHNLASYDVKLWGTHPPLWLMPGTVRKMYQGRPVYNDEKAIAFRGARIVINNLHCSEVWGINVRAFEAAGIGAFQMVDWRPGLFQLFEDGKELISFTTVCDLKQKIDYWLPRQDERKAIADLGQRRAHAEHTYVHRLKLLIATVEGRENGFPVPKFPQEYN